MRAYTVETRSQAVAIFGGQESLASNLVHGFLSRGIHAARIISLAGLKELLVTHDPDYLVMFADFAKDQFISTLQPLLNSGQSRLVVVRHGHSPAGSFALTPVFKELIFSDYVGNKEIFSPLITSWLANIKSKQAIKIPGDGLGELNILGESDLAKLIILAVLNPSTEIGEKLPLGNSNPISLLNLAYLIRSSLPYKVSISFDPANQPTNLLFGSDIYDSTLKKLNYSLTDSVEDNLATYLHNHLNQPIAPTTPTASPPTPPLTPPIAKKLTPLKMAQPVFVPLQFKKIKRIQRARAIVWRGLFIAAALYLTTIAFATTVSTLSLRQTLRTLQNNELPKTNKLNIFTTNYLRANLIALTSILGLSKQPMVVDANILLDAYTQGLSALKTTQLFSATTEELINYVFGSGNADVAHLISLSRLQTEELYQKLSLLDGSLPQTPLAVIPTKYQADYNQGKVKLALLKRSILSTKALLAATPDIIGLGGRRKYAVLFQNNMELRATGGFIGSFGIMSFENGKLYDTPIYDVYDADGQLKGHVEPPLAIKDILGEANWYLRDSNFDPDFPTSARRAEWFIKKSLNQDLDGTIALNINSLISLLRATGPLTVPDYNETITPDNLYERAQFHAEVNFFPGSTQKKEFLSTVGNAIFAKLSSLGAGEGLKLASALSNSVQEKNILISLTNPAINHIFQTLAWSGELIDSPDYAMVVDSNFGVNKANYFVKRNIEEIITLDKNLAVSHLLRLHYQNTSTSTAWPAGIYKNYQRLYLPVGANITSVKLGANLLDPKDYSLTSEHNKFIVAYLVQVPINDKVIVEIEYTTPPLPQSGELLYTWYWQKQPGTSELDNLLVYLNYPMYLKPAVISPLAELGVQQLKFALKNDTDHRLSVKFTK